jgi:hypothetical protein
MKRARSPVNRRKSANGDRKRGTGRKNKKKEEDETKRKRRRVKNYLQRPEPERGKHNCVQIE